jgi:hypothetical protein
VQHDILVLAQHDSLVMGWSRESCGAMLRERAGRPNGADDGST